MLLTRSRFEPGSGEVPKLTAKEMKDMKTMFENVESVELGVILDVIKCN